MKKILIILMILGFVNAAKAQTNPFPSIDSLEKYVNRYIRNSAVEAFQNLRMNTVLIGLSRFLRETSIGSGVDTMFAVNDSTLRLVTHEPQTFNVVIRGNGGIANTNLGAGFRILIQSSQGIRTLFAGYGIINDSTTNANGITQMADTLALATRAWRQKGDDSVAAVLRGVIADTAASIRADFPAGGAAGLTTIVRGPLDVLAGDSAMGIPDTLVLDYGRGLDIDNDSTLILDNAYIDSMNLSKALNDYAVPIQRNAGMIGIGNSIVAASGLYTTLFEHLRKVVGGTFNNYGIPSGDANIIGDMLRNSRLPFSRTQAVYYMNYINSIRFTQNDAMKEWIRHSLRAVLVQAFKYQSTDALNMGVIAGSWANYGGLTKTVASKTDCRVTADSLAELSFNITDGQPSIFISFITNKFDDVNVYSDSVGIYRSGGTVLLATVNLNRQGHINGMPYVVWLPATDVFGPITIRNLKSDTLIVDYAGTTALNNASASVIISEITKVATGALQPGIGHDWWDTCNAVIRQVVADDFTKYGYPVNTVDVNNGFKYDDPLYMTDLPGSPTTAIHPTTYAHFNVFLPQFLKKAVLNGSEKEPVEYATNVALYSAASTNYGHNRTIVLPTISQNSQLNIADDSAYITIGNELTIINNNATGFAWSAVFWDYKEPNGTTGTALPNTSVMRFKWTKEGYRLINRYGVDQFSRTGDSLILVSEGKRYAVYAPTSGGGGTPAGAEGDVQINTAGAFGAENTLNYNTTTNKLLAGDSVSTIRLRANQLIPATADVFAVRSLTGNAISLPLQNTSNTNLINISVDGTTAASITAISSLSVIAGAGQDLSLAATGGTTLRVRSNGRVSINEGSPLYKFHSFENATSQTSSTRAVYGINQATHNTTSGVITSVGVFGFGNSTRATGANELINVGVYGLGQVGGQQNYGMISEAMTNATNTVVPSMRITSNSTASTANGFGTGFFLGAENGSAANVNIAEMQAVYTDVTAASEDADINFRSVTNGSLTTKFSLFGSTGNAGVNTSGADRRLDILDAAAAQLRLTHTDGSVYGEFQVNGSGNLFFTGSNASPLFGLGGTTSAFPALIRDGASIQVKLADNSANANLKVLDQAYSESTWNGNDEVPTKNAVRDKVESLNIVQGTYTPTLTNTINVDASSVYGTFYYQRIDNRVTVTGTVSIDVTSGSLSTQLDISLPIASALTNFYQLTGQSATNGGTVGSTYAQAGAIFGDVTNDRASLVFLAGTLNVAGDYTIRFTYEVL